MQQIIDKDAILLKFQAKNLLNRDLQKADNVFCKIFLKNGNQEELLITQTNVAKVQGKLAFWPGEIHFYPFTLVDFTFELIQTIRVEIYETNGQNIDQLIAQVNTNVGEIIIGIWFVLDIINIKKIGELQILKEIALENNVQHDKNTNYMLWKAENLLDTKFFSKSDPFLIFYKMMYQKWENVLKTDYIKDTLNPTWYVIEISDELLYQDNPQELIKIECWDHQKSGKHIFIGETVTSKKEIENNRREFILSINGNTKGFGVLKLLEYQRGCIPKFIDYLIGGEQWNLIIGIDFTESNGNPQSPKSLHYINGPKLNQYQQTIKAFCDIVLKYTHQFDKKNIQMFGFGGIPSWNFKAKFCFPLNDNEDHHLRYIKDVLQVYESSVKQVKQSGPTYVAEILKYAKKQAKNEHRYLILLIIIDGIINDMAETKKLILKCEQLPISIIFVGVGDEDFSEMKIVFQNLDVSCRQTHQFESFKDYNDPVLLMQAVLKKIPEQYLKYTKINGIVPINYVKKMIK